MWLILVTMVLLVIWLHWRYKNRRIIAMARQLPGPPALPIVGNALIFMVKPQAFIKVMGRLMNVYGDVFRFWLGTELNVCVSNPDDVKIILTNNKANMKGPQYKYMADMVGGGLLCGSGTQWKKHRKMSTPSLSKHAIESHDNIFNNEADHLIQKLTKISDGQQLDIYNYLATSTSSIVCQTLMGLTEKETMELPYFQSLIDFSPELYDIVFYRMTKWYLQIDPVFWLTKYRALQNEGKQQIRVFSTAVIKHRMEKLKNRKEEINENLLRKEADSMDSAQLNVIDRFILSQELELTELIDETYTIFTASQDTTAKMSSFLLLMMAYHPLCQEKLYEEIVRVIGRDNRPITDEDLKQMPYLEMSYKEVTRLFPIAGLMQRTVTEDIAINSCNILAGTSVIIPVYHMHRDPKYWSDPDAFDPERFNLENTKTRNPNIFIPFSLGSMDCIGRHFGTKLVKTLAVKIMQNFKLITLQNYKDLGLKISISVTALDGFRVILMPRSNVK